jgi:hypothetical protein
MPGPSLSPSLPGESLKTPRCRTGDGSSTLPSCGARIPGLFLPGKLDSVILHGGDSQKTEMRSRWSCEWPQMIITRMTNP